VLFTRLLATARRRRGLAPQFSDTERQALEAGTVWIESDLFSGRPRLASRSLALSAVVLIPNSVGPGELLLEYGTREQRDRRLPCLAAGAEIPCFALTCPTVGPRAGASRCRSAAVRG
jgi:hypothetical protein